MSNNNFIKNSIKRLGFGLTAVAAGLILSGSTAFAIPYVPGDNTTASPVPAFNVFTGVPGQGTESDFLRARVPTADGDSSTPYVDPLNASCAAGQKIQMKVYVHNGASVNGNNGGSGPSVAHGTKVRVNLNDTFKPTATISASNAATVNDNVTINCGNKTVKLNYISGSAKQFSLAKGTTAVSDSIVTTGAAINSNGVAGDVWGCFDQRVYVLLTVEVKDTPKPPPEKPKESLGECKLIDVKAEKVGRKVTATVTGGATNAQVVGYKIDWGDGKSSDKQTDTHNYDKDNTPYVITGSVKIKLQDGSTVWKSVDSNSKCAKQVTFKGEKPPEVTTSKPKPPTTPGSLIKTGPAGVATAFVGVTGLSTLLYNRFGRRFGL